MIDTYPYKAIAPGIYEINEFDGVSMFLICGCDRALLVDTGIGIGNLPAFVNRLAEGRPLDVFLTHNHRDHTGNAPAFPRVHISAVDAKMSPLLFYNTTKASRLSFTEHTRQMHPDTVYPWKEADLAEFTREPEIINVEDGHVFDLGGRRLTCWYCPGHTPGSMVLIDSETGILICGDAVNQNVGIGVRPTFSGIRHATIEEAALALDALSKKPFDRKQIFNGHSDFRSVGKPLKPYVFDTLREGLHSIVNDNYVSRRVWIQMIEAMIETAVFRDVQVQFHPEMIRLPETRQKGEGVSA